MGVSYNVVGITDIKDAKYNDYLEIYKRCKANNVIVPDDVKNYFGYMNPEKMQGNCVDLPSAWSSSQTIVREFRDDYKEGIDVDLTQLPEGVRWLRFYASY